MRPRHDLAALVVILVAACGSDDGESDSAGGAGGTTPGSGGGGGNGGGIVAGGTAGAGAAMGTGGAAQGAVVCPMPDDARCAYGDPTEVVPTGCPCDPSGDAPGARCAGQDVCCAVNRAGEAPLYVCEPGILTEAGPECPMGECAQAPQTGCNYDNLNEGLPVGCLCDAMVDRCALNVTAVCCNTSEPTAAPRYECVEGVETRGGIGCP